MSNLTKNLHFFEKSGKSKKIDGELMKTRKNSLVPCLNLADDCSFYAINSLSDYTGLVYIPYIPYPQQRERQGETTEVHHRVSFSLRKCDFYESSLFLNFD